MQLQPPTDNLYKFMSVGGIALLIAAGYFLNVQYSDSYRRRFTLENEYNEIVVEFHRNFGSKVMHDELGITKSEADSVPLQKTLAFSTANANEEEKKHILEHINLHDRQLRALMTPPDRDPESNSFWASWFARTPEELARWQKEKPNEIESIRLSAIEFRPRYEKCLSLVSELWLNQSSFKTVAWICGIGIVLGALSALCGFILWYRLVQQLQDKILRYDLVEKSRKSGSN